MPITSDSFAMNGSTPGIFNPATVPGSAPNPVLGDPVKGARLAAFQAVNAATADTQIPLPLGARIVSITYLPSVAATGSTSGLSFGSTQGGADIAANTSILGTNGVSIPLALNGARPLLVANFASINASSAGGSVVWMRNTQTVQTAVGTGTVVVEYVMA